MEWFLIESNSQLKYKGEKYIRIFIFNVSLVFALLQK